MSSKVRVAVLGYGHLGKWHCQKVEGNPDAQLVAIVDPSPASQSKAREAHPSAKIVADISDVLDQIDAAVIVTPTTYHYEMIQILAKASKHILCEKPVCASVKEIEALEKLSRENKDLVWQVGHSERFHQAWEILKDKAHVLDEVHSNVYMNRLAPFHVRAKDVDVVSDLMIHDIDLMTYLFKEKPTRVIATGFQIRTDKWDSVNAHFSFASGRNVIIRSHRDFTKAIRDFEITNAYGTHHVDLATNEISFSIQKAPFDVATEKMSYEKRDHLMIENKHFIDSIINKKAPIISFADGLWACKMAFAVLESVSLGRSVEL